MGSSEQNLKSITVGEEDHEARLDAYLAKLGNGYSRSQTKKLITSGAVLLNDKECKPADLVRSGDKIAFLQSAPELPASRLVPAEIPLDILYEDDDLIVLNKPKGLVVHPGAGTTEPTLVEGLLYHWGRRDVMEGLEQGDVRPGIVHRLDKDTSGVMVCARTDEAHRHLAKQFEEKTNLREYVALLDGAMQESETVVESYLCRDPRDRLKFTSVAVEEFQKLEEEGKGAESYRYAKSHFYRHTIFGNRITLVKVRLYTGRTHQIRLHALALKMPVIGDPLYHPGALQLPPSFPPAAKTALQRVGSQLLHARVLGFTHPKTGRKMAFEAPLPDEFREVLGILNDKSH